MSRNYTVVFLGDTEECVYSAMVAAAEKLSSMVIGEFKVCDLADNSKGTINKLSEGRGVKGSHHIQLKSVKHKLILTDKKDTEDVTAYVLCQDLYPEKMVKNWLEQRIRKQLLDQLRRDEKKLVTEMLRDKLGIVIDQNREKLLYSTRMNKANEDMKLKRPVPVLLLYNQRSPLGSADWMTPGNLDQNRRIRKLFPEEAYICEKSGKSGAYASLLAKFHLLSSRRGSTYYTRLRCSAYRHLPRTDTVQIRKEKDKETAEKLKAEIQELYTKGKLNKKTVTAAGKIFEDAQLRADRQQNDPDNVDKLAYWILYVTGILPISMGEVIPNAEIPNLSTLKYAINAPEIRNVMPWKQTWKGGFKVPTVRWERTAVEAAVRCYLFENPSREDLICANVVNWQQLTWVKLCSGWRRFWKRQSGADQS